MSCCCKALEKITNPELKAWVKEFAEHTTPDNIVICDGTQEEFDRLAAAEVARGAWVKLNEEKRPGCYLVRSHESDVARVEKRTYICCKDKNNAGDGPHRDEDHHVGPLQGLHEGPYDVRHPLLHGPHRLAPRQARR